MGFLKTRRSPLTPSLLLLQLVMLLCCDSITHRIGSDAAMLTDTVMLDGSAAHLSGTAADGQHAAIADEIADETRHTETAHTVRDGAPARHSSSEPDAISGPSFISANVMDIMETLRLTQMKVDKISDDLVDLRHLLHALLARDDCRPSPSPLREDDNLRDHPAIPDVTEVADQVDGTSGSNTGRLHFINQPLPMQAVVAMNAPPGTPVFTLHASDPDPGHDLRYFLVRDRSGGQFEVDERSGAVRTRGTDRFLLDMEYVLYVKVEDHAAAPDERGRFPSSPEQRLSIVGGKRPPQFFQTSYETSIAEDHARFAEVVVTQARSFSGRPVRYSLKPCSGHTAGTFAVNSSSGVVTLARPLDYDDPKQLQTHRMWVLAEEVPPRVNASVLVTIHLTDVNDNSPKFQLPFYQVWDVFEDTPAGSEILRVNATDADSGTNAKITYSLRGAEAESLFRVDDDGIIYTRRELNADVNRRIYEFVVVANDAGEPSRSGTTVVWVYTKTRGGRARFTEGVYTATVPENIRGDTLVTAVRACDPDGHQVTYSFTSTEEVPFTLDSETGEIRARTGVGLLKEDKYETASAAGPDTLPSSTASAMVVIFVYDINDHRPDFTECDGYRPVVAAGSSTAESRQFVLRVEATDRDRGRNGQVTYDIVRIPGPVDDEFIIDSETGDVFITKVSAEAGERLVPLVVRAVDGGSPPLHAVCVITVHITSAHTPAGSNMEELIEPRFDHSFYRVKLTEENDRVLPKRILQVTATAGGTDQTKSVVYFLSGQGVDTNHTENSTFIIDETYGDIFVTKLLDRDSPGGQSQWQFTVLARDRGGNGLVGYAEVQVDVTDINDNPPAFASRVLVGDVIENGPEGVFVVRVEATDADDPDEPRNTKLFYSIHDESFTIEPETGIIRTSICCLDRELTPHLDLQVTATDPGGLRGTAIVLVRVTDMNDCPPRFSQDQYNITIDKTSGDLLPEDAVLNVTVFDGDKSNVFLYTILEDSGFGAEKFIIVPGYGNNAALKVISSLDYEDESNRNGFSFTVQVDDDGGSGRTGRARVNIQLRDINDNAPVFNRSSLEVNVREDVPVGYTLAKFEAHDPDGDDNESVSYTIDEESDPGRLFNISEDGVIFVQRGLDRESEPLHHVTILAIDGGVPANTATAMLTVFVDDVNDNAPTLLEDYTFLLAEHSSPRRVGRVRATDADGVTNGPPFLFRMDPNADDVIRSSFRIEQDIGGADGDGMAVVTSLTTFHRHQRDEYRIPIVIRDSGNPPASATSTLTVRIRSDD